MPVVWTRLQRKTTHYTHCYKAHVDHEAQTVGGMMLENQTFFSESSRQPTKLHLKFTMHSVLGIYWML